MEELFTCPICKLSFGHKARLRKHIKKHTKSLEKNLAKANSTKKAEHEKMLIQERIARTGRGPLGIRKLSYVKIFKLNG
ncbi:C2H2-type zinc finger protein [Klebsiella quasipneumoniae]|uniref:C2H2-type zinc finger protein n=1 Tax=Klebsiella quasipneumoniae TaxID=1463165 RepID=UPI002E790B27|nr:C2H2-type zinc finger protein [Klebsiella quasipneumoniae]